jgi:hypothetical protein
MRLRAIDKKIATCLVEGKAKKLSQRDEVVMDNGTAVYILWYTWIVMRKPDGELVWNTGNFSFSGTRTTKSRYKYLPAAIEWAKGIAQI